MGPEMTDGIAAALRRYLEIQDEEGRLRREKKTLAKRLATHLGGHGNVSWKTTLGDKRVTVRMQTREKPTWDAELLRSRLGDRYRAVLRPDPALMRKHLEEIAPQLEPKLELIGAPTQESIRLAIKDGLVQRDEVNDALRFETNQTVSVARWRPQRRT